MKLLSGLIVRNPARVLNRAFGSIARDGWPYEMYDGVKIAHDNILHPEDIAISVNLASGLTVPKLFAIWKVVPQINKSLKTISQTVNLHDNGIPWQDLSLLLQHFINISGVGPALCTKILHKKRPKLIPIVDGLLQEHYYHAQVNYRKSFHDQYGAELRIYSPQNIPSSVVVENILQIIKCFRIDLRNNVDPISNAVHELPFPDLSPVRALEKIIWWKIYQMRQRDRNV
jgi:hypothetical protein